MQQTGDQCGLVEAEKMTQEYTFSSIERDPRLVVKNTFIDLHDDQQEIIQRRWRYRSCPDVEAPAEQGDTSAVSDGSVKPMQMHHLHPHVHIPTSQPPEIENTLTDEAADVTAVSENTNERAREAAMPTGKPLLKWNVHLDGREVVVKNTFIDIDAADEEEGLSFSRRAYQTCPDSVQEYLAQANYFEPMPAVAEEPSSLSADGTTHIDQKGIDICAGMSATQPCTVEAVHAQSIESREPSIKHPVLLGKAFRGGHRLRIKNTFLDIGGDSTPTPANRRSFRTCPDMESEVIQQTDDERLEYNQQGAAQRSPSLESAPEGAPRYVDHCRRAQEAPQTRAARNVMYNTEDLQESFGQEPLQLRTVRNTMYNTEDLREDLGQEPLQTRTARNTMYNTDDLRENLGQEPLQTRTARNTMYNTEDLREDLGQEPLQTRTARNTMYNTEDLRESLCASNRGVPCHSTTSSTQAEVARGISGATQIQNDHPPRHAHAYGFPVGGNAATQQAKRDVITSNQCRVQFSLHANIHTGSNQSTTGTQNNATAIPAQGFAANPALQFFSMNPYCPMNQMHLQFAQTSTSTIQHPPGMWNSSLPPVRGVPTVATPEGGDAVPDCTKRVEDPTQEDLTPPSNAEGALHGEGPRGRRLRLWAHIYLHMEEKGFDLVPRLIGRKGENMRKIAEETNAKVRIRGKGSGHFEVDGKFEAPTPLMVAVTTDHEQQSAFSRAIEMTLLELRKVEQRYRTWCHKKNIALEGPYFSIGLLSEGADKVLGNLLDGVSMSGPAKSRR